MKLPASIIRAFLPNEAKAMLNALKGHRTLILLVIANLPDVAHAIANVASGVGNEDLATNIVKIVTGVVSVFTVLVRLIPEGAEVK